MTAPSPSPGIVVSAAACPCGTSTFRVSGRPLARFYCHCRICQGIYKAPCADVTAFRAGDVSPPADDLVSYKRYRLPPAVQRATCRNCGAPVVGFMWVLPLLRVGFVPSRNVAAHAALPAPAAHIFYHRRVGDVADALPKYSGYWPSELAATRMLVGGALG